jgi:hypothetical protein
MLELISASVASLPLEFAELLELIDNGRFPDVDIVLMTTPPRYLEDEKPKSQSVDRTKMHTAKGKSQRAHGVPRLWGPRLAKYHERTE